MKKFVCVFTVLFSVFCLYAEPKKVASENGKDYYFDEVSSEYYVCSFSKLPYEIMDFNVRTYFESTGSENWECDDDYPSLQVLKDEVSSYPEEIGEMENMIYLLEKGYNFVSGHYLLEGYKVTGIFYTAGGKIGMAFFGDF